VSLSDLYRYRLDICAFMNDKLGIKPHVGQEEFLYTVFPPGVEPKDWPFREATLAAANRWAKSVSFMAIHIWGGSFKHLLPHEYASQAWFDQTYPIINICPVTDLAYAVRGMVGEVLEDRAKEQIERPGGRGHIDPFVAALFNENPDPKGKSRYLVPIPDTNYDGYITAHNTHLEYRTTDDNAKALQSRKFYIVTYDEFTREKDPLALIASDIRPRVLDTLGLIISAGTPHLETQSTAELVWEQGNPLNPDRNPKHISMMRPLEDNPAITKEMRDDLILGSPDYLVPQILEGKFVQSEEAFYNSLSIDLAAQDIPNQRRRTRGHTYVIAFDLAIAKDGDNSIGVVWDVTQVPIVVTEVLVLPKGTKQDALIREMADQLAFYNSERFGCTALMIFDGTGMGGAMVRDDLAGLRPRPKAFNFAGSRSKKLGILKNLKIFLDKKMLVYPKSATRMTFELKRYRRKDEKLETDSVMANAMAAHLASRLLLPVKGIHIVTEAIY